MYYYGNAVEISPNKIDQMPKSNHETLMQIFHINQQELLIKLPSVKIHHSLLHMLRDVL